MMSQPSERATIVGVIQPVNGNNATTLSASVDMSKWAEAAALIQMGVIDQVVDFKLVQSATSGGTYSNITGKSITQFAATDDGKSAWINLKSEELDIDKPFIKASVTVGNGTSSLISVVLLGLKPRYGPASDDKLSTLAQVVT